MDLTPDPVVAESGRLRLRLLSPPDAPFLVRLMNEPSWLQNIGDRGIRSAADAERYLETTALAMYRTRGFGMYLVEKRADGAAIGLCGLVRRDALPEADLGFALLPEFWGQGYAREAAAAVLAHARTALGIFRLLAIVAPHNRRSVALLERLGFQAQGEVQLGGEALALFAWVAPAP